MKWGGNMELTKVHIENVIERMPSMCRGMK